MTIDQFVAKYNGVHIDEDGYYGAQCWDTVARYAREVVGCSPFPTGSGGAEGLYRLFLPPIPTSFIRVPASDLRKGDIVVWSKEFYNPFGHTALVWERDGNSILVFEQDGAKDYNGDGNADGVAYVAQRTITNQVSGGLRPIKGVISNMPTENEVRNFLSSYLNIKNPSKEQVAYYTARPWSELAGNICDNMLGRIQPRPKEIVDFLKKYLEKVATEKDVNYYTVRPWQVLFDDVSTTLKNRGNTPVNKTVVLEYINKNLS